MSIIRNYFLFEQAAIALAFSRTGNFLRTHIWEELLFAIVSFAAGWYLSPTEYMQAFHGLIVSLAAIGSITLLSLFWNFAFSPFLIWKTQKEEIARNTPPVNPLKLVFPKEANEEGKFSLFKRSYCYLPNGLSSIRDLSFHDFYIGVENTSTDKTIKNVYIRFTHIFLVQSQPYGIFNSRLKVDTTDDAKMDINPGETGYFFLGSGWDDTKSGLSSPKIVSQQEYDEILSNHGQYAHSRFSIKPKDEEIPLPKNDGYIIKIVIHALDSEAKEGFFILNTKNTISLVILSD